MRHLTEHEMIFNIMKYGNIGYSVQALWYSCSQLLIRLAFQSFDCDRTKGYSRNALCALNLISTFYLYTYQFENTCLNPSQKAQMNNKKTNELKYCAIQAIFISLVLGQIVYSFFGGCNCKILYCIEQNIFYFHKEVPSRGKCLHNNTCTYNETFKKNQLLRG